jgi:hypothetical protein
MPSRLEVATRHTAAELRRLARHEQDRRAAVRMLALAETMDGADRATAEESDLQQWVKFYGRWHNSLPARRRGRCSVP